MASPRRIERLNVVIREELAKILIREIEFPIGVLVTVSRVRAAEDLFNAEIALSVLPTEQGEAALKLLGEHIFDIQQLLNKRLRMRPVPKIRFVQDTTEAEAAEVEAELYKLQKSGDRG